MRLKLNNELEINKLMIIDDYKKTVRSIIINIIK